MLLNTASYHGRGVNGEKDNMVALVKKKIKIFKGQTPYEELQQAFRDEIADIMKDAALRMGCDASQLKCRFNSLGQVEVAKMTGKEMAKREAERQKKKLIAIIRKRKGLSDG